MIDKHYLAGFFDGEGCIFTCIKKSKHPKKTYLYPDLNIHDLIGGQLCCNHLF